MADPISAFAAYATAQIVAAVGTTSVLTAQIIYASVYAATAVGVGTALNYASSSLNGQAPRPSGQVVAGTGSTEPNRHLFGRSRTYGVMAWQGSFAWNGTGVHGSASFDELNKGFGQMQVISSTPITEIEAVFAADIELVGIPETLTGAHVGQAVNMAPYNSNQPAGQSRLYFNYDIGSDPGVRDPLLSWWADQPWQPLVTSPYPDDLASDGGPLVPFYGDDARGDGLAKLSSVAYQDVNSFPQGPPRMSVVAKGIKIFDPRDPDQGSQDPSTWQWSENPALVAAWYVTRPFGFAASYSDIDFDTLISAANACDEEVDTFVSLGGTEKRYRCGGEVIEDQSRDATLAAICATMAGSWCQTGGRWYFYAGVFNAPTESIDNGWIMRAIEFVAQGSRLQLYNTVRGTYPAEDRRWQPAPYPQVQDPVALAADNGVEIIEQIDLAFCPSPSQAQRCMLIELRRRHKPRSFKFETPLGYALRLIVGQTVSLTQTDYGYQIEAVPFRVSAWGLAQQEDSGEIWASITLVEDGADIYDGTVDDLTDSDGLTPSDEPGTGAASSGDNSPTPPTGSVSAVIV